MKLKTKFAIIDTMNRIFGLTETSIKLEQNVESNDFEDMVWRFIDVKSRFSKYQKQAFDLMDEVHRLKQEDEIL